MTKELSSVVYGSNSKRKHLGYHLLQTLKGLSNSHYLAYQLTKRDISAQYRQSVLGLLWAFIIPFANTIVWILLNGSGVVNLSDPEMSYPVYVFTGTMIWAIFLESVNAPLEKTNLNKSILTKVNFKREALLLSGIYQSLFNAGIKVAVMILFVLFMGFSPSKFLLALPFAIFAIIVCGTAIGIIITPIGMLYSDISKALPFVMQFFMFTVPVVFLSPTEGLMAKIVNHNPLTPLITVSRNLLTGSLPDQLEGFILTSGVGFLLLLIGLTAFRISIPILVERMNA